MFTCHEHENGVDSTFSRMLFAFACVLYVASEERPLQCTQRE